MSEQVVEREPIPRARLRTTNKQEQTETRRSALLKGLCTIQELADALGVNQRTVYLHMERGMPYTRLGAVRYLSLERVNAWIMSREIDLSPRGRGRPRKVPLFKR
jgi:predicted ArsR family transcriptional regulator